MGIKEYNPTTVSVQEGWVCWAALWTHWTTVGSMETSTICKVMTVDAACLERSLTRNAIVRSLSRAYAAGFHAQLLAMQPRTLSLPTDLDVPSTEDIVLYMASNIRQL